MNYACGFSQSETEKYFEWIIMFNDWYYPEKFHCNLLYIWRVLIVWFQKISMTTPRVPLCIFLCSPSACTNNLSWNICTSVSASDWLEETWLNLSFSSKMNVPHQCRGQVLCLLNRLSIKILFWFLVPYVTWLDLYVLSGTPVFYQNQKVWLQQ